MKRLINLTILTLILLSFIGCFDDEARFGEFPHIEITDTVHIVSHEAQTLEVPLESNRTLNLAISTDDNPNNNPDTDPWISKDSYSPKIKLYIKQNYTDYERVATITVSSESITESFKIKVTQMHKGYSPAQIFQGDAIISTQEEYNAFVNKEYKEIQGNLIIGTSTKVQNSTKIPVEIDGTTHYFEKNNKIKYLGNLSSLRKISGGIYIVGLDIQYLSFVQNILNLETLVAIHNPKLNDISTLSRLKKLKKLHLNNNNLSNITFLSHMNTLETLYLGHTIDESNSITDISPLLLLPNLKELYLNYLSIPLSQLNNVKTKLPNTKISTEGIPGINPAQIYRSNLFIRTQQDVNNFIATGYKEVNGSIIIGKSTTTRPATFLTNIWINGTNHYITQSNSAIDLSSLKIHHIQGIVYLAGFSNITDLNSISSLSRATNLQILANNNLTDISTLTNLSKLTNLTLNDNKNLTNFSPLSNLVKLRNLYIYSERISDLTLLYPLKQLETIYFSSLSNITLTQINALKVKLPNCTITHNGINN